MINIEHDPLELQLPQDELKYQYLRQNLLSLNKELEAYKKSYSELYDANPIIIFTIDDNFLIQSLNNKAELFLNLNKESLLNTVFLNYLPSRAKPVFFKAIQALMDKEVKQTCTIEIIQNDYCKHMNMECTLTWNRLIHLYFTDVSSTHQLKHDHFELEQSFILINKLYQGASDALAALDNELNFKIINEPFNTLFSKIVATNIHVGINLMQVLEPFPELKMKIVNACQHALAGKKIVKILENSIKQVDEYYCYELSIHSFYNPGHQKNELIFRIKDLTTYKLEERLHHRWQSEIALSCRTSAMGEMASALAHEINQPLSSIVAYSRSCLFIMNNFLGVNLKEKLAEPLEKIAIQAELAGEIIHNMKNLRRNGNVYREPTDINLLIKDALSILNYEFLDLKLTITLNLAEGLPKVMANKIHMMQILLNLARNSIEACQNNHITNPELIITTEQSGEYISIHVQDNGPGIPDKYRDKILNTYFTTKPKGTGIGLGICRTLVEEHGGKLNIQAHKEPGAWCTFTLPINRNDQNL